MNELIEVVREQYNIELLGIGNYREGFLGQLESSKLFIKKMNVSNERIQFIYEVKTYLSQRGFNNIDKYHLNKENMPYFTFNDSTYTICDIFEGKECSFEQAEDCNKAIRTLATMHKASLGFKKSEGYIRSELGNLPEILNKRYSDFLKVKKIADKRKSKFDYLLLGNIKDFLETAKEAMDEVNSGEYARVVEISKSNPVVCHHDYSYNNIIINKGTCNVINFDNCCFDLKIYDIVNVIRRKMRKSGWNVREAVKILEDYNKIFEITMDEIKILIIMLKFPQKLWRIVNKYYNSKRAWADKYCIEQLEELIIEKSMQKRFISDFEREIFENTNK